MVTRFRWYRLQLPGSLRIGLNRLSSQQFTRRSEFGFLTIAQRPRPVLRYLCRNEMRIPTLNDEGSVDYVSVSAVTATELVFLSGQRHTILRVVEPSRSSRELLNRLEDAWGFGFVAEPVLFDRFVPGSAWPKGFSVRLHAMKVVGTQHGCDVVTRAELASRAGFLQSEVPLLRTFDNYRVDGWKLDVAVGMLRGTLSVSRGGVVRIGGDATNEILGRVEEWIQSQNGRAEEH